MFPKLKTHASCGFYRPCLEVVKEVDEKFVTTFEEDSTKLPPVENFDLKKLLAANVPLEEVNPNILGSRTLGSIVDKINSSFETEPHNPNPKEINNDEE